jgi:hypothetical protein
MHELRDAPFGELRHISKADYQEEVTDASKSHPVILHLYQAYLEECKLVNGHLKEIAQLHRSAKFLCIRASDCIPNYPDKNCPTLLVYVNGEMALQLVGGQKMRTVEQLETALWAVGAINKLTGSKRDSDDDGSESD